MRHNLEALEGTLRQQLEQQRSKCDTISEARHAAATRAAQLQADLAQAVSLLDRRLTRGECTVALNLKRAAHDVHEPADSCDATGAVCSDSQGPPAAEMQLDALQQQHVSLQQQHDALQEELLHTQQAGRQRTSTLENDLRNAQRRYEYQKSLHEQHKAELRALQAEHQVRASLAVVYGALNGCVSAQWHDSVCVHHVMAAVALWIVPSCSCHACRHQLDTVMWQLCGADLAAPHSVFVQALKRQHQKDMQCLLQKQQRMQEGKGKSELHTHTVMKNGTPTLVPSTCTDLPELPTRVRRHDRRGTCVDPDFKLLVLLIHMHNVAFSQCVPIIDLTLRFLAVGKLDQCALTILLLLAQDVV